MSDPKPGDQLAAALRFVGALLAGLLVLWLWRQVTRMGEP